eukprot:TRINITY_DN19896_c0_g1_i2.p1 TRINITY_DN19896_c0_g1~~TRINITY_DN19896_c0_g1_i2.p1  ORF type:complete len:233 (-),score=75.53 TRINITY_DN19896_c0_g1_i2:50-748(-)
MSFLPVEQRRLLWQARKNEGKAAKKVAKLCESMKEYTHAIKARISIPEFAAVFKAFDDRQYVSDLDFMVRVLDEGNDRFLISMIVHCKYGIGRHSSFGELDDLSDEEKKAMGALTQIVEEEALPSIGEIEDKFDFNFTSIKREAFAKALGLQMEAPQSKGDDDDDEVEVVAVNPKAKAAVALVGSKGASRAIPSGRAKAAAAAPAAKAAAGGSTAVTGAGVAAAAIAATTVD